MADRNDGDNPEQLEVLQTLQEMLVRLTRIEVRMTVHNRQFCCSNATQSIIATYCLQCIG